MIEIDGHSLSLEDIRRVVSEKEEVTLTKDSINRISQSREWLEKIVNRGKPIYGINTGLGIFADKKISTQETQILNRNLILSHSVGTGEILPIEVVRAAMLIRANTLAKGHSGVRPVLITTLLEMLNKGVHPIIPSQGSLGSSGDLAPLSHLGLVISTDQEDLDEFSGFASYQGETYSGKKAMSKAGIPRIILEEKEGLALINGATFTAALGSLVCAETRVLLAIAEIALSLSLESLQGISDAFDPRIHESRQHPGQIIFAHKIRSLTQGSSLLDSTDRVQDAYSLRCSPQIHGPAYETLDFAEQVIRREINAATDNPLLFSEGEVISGGNFHGEPVALVMDYVTIALTEISGVSERRIYRLTDGQLNGTLPPMLVDDHHTAGLNSGMMMPQYTAASLVLENRSLSSPDSIHSLPTSASQEDHNANAMTAARHALQVVQNTRHILAIELYTAARALDLITRTHPKLRPGKGSAAAYNIIRDNVPYQPGDTLWGPEIDQVRKLIENGQLLSEVNKAITISDDQAG